MQPGPSTQLGYTDQDGCNGGSTEATANVNKRAAGHDSVPEGDAVNQAQGGNAQHHETGDEQPDASSTSQAS